MQREIGKRKSTEKTIFFLLWFLPLSFAVSVNSAWATLNDVAIYRPGVQGGMTSLEQQASADFIHTNINSTQKMIFAGYDQNTVDSLLSWMSARQNDGKQDILVIIDTCPDSVFHGEIDGSIAEQWMENGNMLIWTGSEPFATYVDSNGTILNDGAGAEGASKVLDVSSPGLCQGSGWQNPTTAAWDHDDADGDYNIGAFIPYEAANSLNYDQLLIDSESSDWNHMSYWRIDEIFAEDSENYQSDNIILVNKDGGQYGQFYCVPGLNDARKEVITQVLNNWMALPGNTLVVPDQFSTIQAAINAAQHRDTVLVKAGTYNEQLVFGKAQRGVKLISDASDGGNDLVSGPGYADVLYGVESKMVLRRSTRTIIDGTGFTGGIEASPMVQFPAGATAGTLFDGFTVTNMPVVNHISPFHARTIQNQGSSTTMINNIIGNNGSSGIMNQAWFFDQEEPDIHKHDFRYANVMYEAHPIIINNVIYHTQGSHIGNNNYAHSIIFNNECFESLTINAHFQSGIGNQHGAHSLVVGNLVYKSDLAGIGSRRGDHLGSQYIDRPTHPIHIGNRIYDSGEHDTSAARNQGAGIGAEDTGGYDPKTGAYVYHIIAENYVNGASNAAIGCRSYDGNDPLPETPDPDDPPNFGHVKILNNEVTGGGRGGYGAGIGIQGAHALEISGNTTYANNNAGIGIRAGGSCDLIKNNTIYDNKATGIGIIESSKVDEISNNNIYNNHDPGISVAGGSEGGIINNNTLDHNGIYCLQNNAAGLVVMQGSSAVIKNTTVSYSGMAGVAVLDEGTSVSLENCTIDHSGQADKGPNLTVQGGAIANVEGSTFAVTIGAPNIMIDGYGTQFTMHGSMVSGSARPGLEASGATLDISETIFDGNGTDLTPGILLTDCELSLRQLTISNHPRYGLETSGCYGSIESSDIFNNGFAGGGQVAIFSSQLDITRNVLREPGGNYFQIQLQNGSSCNVYHNTIVGKADGGAGPFNYGPGDGLYVSGTSAADVRNNIFYRLPWGISTPEGAQVTASTNLYYLIMKSYGIIGDGGIIGDNIIYKNPYLLNDYSLDSYSPCVDAAEPIYGVNDDFSGNGPDIGAKKSGGFRGELSWMTPAALISSDMSNAEDLIDGNLATGLNRGGSYMVLDISDANGNSSPIYGMRFFSGTSSTTWRVYVSDYPEGPWEPVLVDYGWNVDGYASPGVWDAKMVDFFSSGKYLKVARRFAPHYANCVFEFEVQTHN